MKKLLLLSVPLFLLLAAGCAPSEPTASERAPADASRALRVETLVLEPEPFQDAVVVSGEVRAIEDATLSAEAAGQVLALKPLGSFVRRGEVLARLDDRIVRAAVGQAQAALDATESQFALADDTYRRQERLYRDSVISALEFETVRSGRDRARAAVSQARAALVQAQEQLANSVITAPFAGRVEQQLVQTGERVNPGMPVIRLVAVNPVKVVAGVPERYAGDIRTGTPVEVTFSSYGAGRRLGRVSFVGSVVDAGNRTFPVEVQLDNPNGELKPQMVAELSVVREELQDVIVVPRTAVIRDEEGEGVFVVERQDSVTTVARRPVQLGTSSKGRAVVLSGLEAGQEVVVLGQNSLTEGDVVQVVEQHRSAATAELPAPPEDAAAEG